MWEKKKMQIDKLKEQIIGNLVKMREDGNNKVDQMIRDIDKTDDMKQLFEAIKDSPMVHYVKEGMKEHKMDRQLKELKSVEDLLEILGQAMSDPNTEVKIKKMTVGEFKKDIEKFSEMKKESNNDQEHQHAYDMGFDCAVNGANQKNCHVGLFFDKDSKDAWEKGNRAGKLRPQNTPSLNKNE